MDEKRPKVALGALLREQAGDEADAKLYDELVRLDTLWGELPRPLRRYVEDAVHALDRARSVNAFLPEGEHVLDPIGRRAPWPPSGYHRMEA